MMVRYKHSQCLCGKRYFLSDFRIFMFNNCTVEIYSYRHKLLMFYRIIIFVAIVTVAVVSVVTIVTISISAISVRTIVCITSIASIFAILAITVVVAIEGVNSTTNPLGIGNDGLFDNVREELNNWPHRESENIVIISLPKQYLF